MKSFLTPPIQKGKEPPFHEMGAIPFQELCRDLIAVQGEFIDCRAYGDNGQAQFGIDIRCDRKNQRLDVAQAKCYQNFTPSDIGKASNKFFEHIDYWTIEGVKKFILIIACRISSVQANKQITIERQRFLDLDIEYELWDAIRIRDILRDHRELIYTHISNADFWVRNICGGGPNVPYSNNTAIYGIDQINQLLVTQVNSLSSVINSKTSKELEENKALWRECRGKFVIEWVYSKRNNINEWDVLSPEIKGGIVRLEAIINIDYYEDYNKAEQLLWEAREIDPNGFDLRIRAVLTLHKSGPQAALDIIGDVQDTDSICVKASLLLQTGRSSEAITMLESIQDQNNPELFRVLSLAYLEARDLKRAADSIERAKKLDERLESVQIANAVILYFSALSPVVIPDIVLVWPVPIEPDLIKSTDAAIQALEKASTIFLKISQNEYRPESEKFSLKIWHAACQACDFRKQKEAEELFSEMLTKCPTDHRLISWVVVRKYVVNLQKSRTELKKLRGKGSAITTDIISTIMLNVYDQHTRNSLYTLDGYKKVFVKEDNDYLWEYWYIQILIAQGKFIEARKRLEESIYHAELEPLKLLLLNREGQINGNDQPFIDHIVSLLATGDQPLYLLELCHYYASKQKWKLVAQYADNLVSEIQTTEAFRLSSFSLFKEGRFRECKDFIENHKSLCFENKLPDDINLFYIQSKALSGKFLEALTDLRNITEINPSKQNLALLFDFYTRKGDRAGLQYVMTLAKEKGNIPPDDLISYANSMLWASREIAEDLWRSAPTEQLSTHKIIEKMVLAFALGFDHDMRDINNLLPEIIGKQGSPIWQVTQDEAIDISYKNYRRVNELFQQFSIGEVPTCNVFTNNNSLNLFVFYKNTISYNNSPTTPVNQKIPLFIRYGGKPSLTDFKEPKSPFEVNLFSIDITSSLSKLKIGNGTILASKGDKLMQGRGKCTKNTLSNLPPKNVSILKK